MSVFTVSGYKPHEIGIFNDKHPGLKYIKKAIQVNLIQLIENEGLEWVLISGQQGVELWAGEVTIELQQAYPQLKLAVITPFLAQEEQWKEEKQEFYHFILSQADYVVSLTKRNYESPTQFRMKNQFFIEKSDGLLLLYDEEKEGTPKYILLEARKKQLKKNGFHIQFITPYDLEVLVEEERMENLEF